MTSRKRQSSIKYQVRDAVRPTVAPLTTAIGGALAAGTLQAATITVSSLDGGNVSGECTLRSALYAASTNSTFGTCPSGDAGEDIIEFDSALSGTINLEAAQGANLYYDGSTLPIGEDLRIYGDGRITIDGSGDAPVFYAKYDPGEFDADDVRFYGLTITGGGGDYGGAILARNRSLRIRDSVITNHIASVSGGAIWHKFEGNQRARMYLSSSEVSGNQSLDSAGGGGAIYAGSDRHSVQIASSLVSNNVSLGSGGAALIASPDASVKCYESDISDNSAKYGNGGAIHADGSTGAINFRARYCDFTGNEAGQNGGAIAIQDILPSGQIAGQTIVVSSTTFAGNDAGGIGGGMWLDRGDGSPSDDVHSIEIVSPSSYEQRTVFSDNTAQDAGGALYISAGDNIPVNFSRADFLSNQVVEGNGGGADISLGDGDLSFSDVTFSFNQTNTQSSDQLIGRGGGLIASLSGGDFYASELNFFNNTATSFGGARIGAGGGAVGIEYAQFLNNRALGGPVGALNVGSPERLGLRNSVFRLNESTLRAGGLSIGPSNMTNVPVEVKYSEFSNNNGSDGAGGAISVVAGSGSTLFLKNSTISGNQGGVGPAVTATGAMELEIKYSTIADNYASISRGGVYSNLANGCRISNSILAGNTVGPDGQAQDLSAGDYECDVDHSLVSGKYSEFNDVAGNLLFQDPRMDPLADNGGSGGRTHALRADSPAVDAGDAAATAPSTDQRGSPFVRIFGSEVDMGGYERQYFPDAIFSDRFESP